jgi:hypothetical protein
MPLSVPLTPETEARPAAAGMNVETFAARTLERVAAREAFHRRRRPARRIRFVLPTPRQIACSFAP